MMHITFRARWAVAAATVAFGPMLLSGCDVKQSLVGLQQPSLITPASVVGPTGANALYVGVIGRFKNWAMGSNGNATSFIMEGDLLTDEWKTGDTFIQNNNADARTLPTNDALMQQYYDAAQTLRSYALTARQFLQSASPDSTANIGEMFFAQGFAEMMMGEDLCNGIPLGITVNGVPQYSAPLTDAQVLAVVKARMDSALAIVKGTDAHSLQIHYALETTEARALVDVGDYADAIKLTADVPTSFQYLFTFDVSTGDNQLWNITASSHRVVVGDSFDLIGGFGGPKNIIANALPFASANDPRVPVTGSTTNNQLAIDGLTPLVENKFYGTRDESYPVITGLDARLIETEAMMNAGNYAGMMASLNALRAAPPKLGVNTVAPMAALPNPVPTTAAAAIAIFFREKAFWQFARGYRLGDERRMVRIYGMDQSQVYPSGVFFKGGNYGSQVVLWVTDDEKTNPLFTGCLDTKA
jgi:starch-binding outer membrane protein, SusD/RagB family